MEFKFKFRDDVDFPASMTLVLGKYEIRGFAIRKSKFPNEKIRHALYPPAKNLGGAKWLHLFYVPDKAEWSKLEKAVLEKFYPEQDEYLMKQIAEETSPITLEEIEF